MGTATRVQILDETVCILHKANTLKKGMNPVIPSPAISKSCGRQGSSALICQTVEEKENYEFKHVKLRLKIDLVSHPTFGEGLGINKYTQGQFLSRILLVCK